MNVYSFFIIYKSICNCGWLALGSINKKTVVLIKRFDSDWSPDQWFLFLKYEKK